ncbi:MAG: C10 family peptidase, partial [Duncaniella sp.]|nr:C10 family peptidase [Duncaniella sp.]
ITPITPLASRAADDQDINLVKSLIMAVGYGIKTNYGVDNSFADGYDVAYALVNYFGYDKGLNYISRNFYTQADWNKKIYDELVNNGPVYYDGKNASYTGRVADGGFYSFVIDGYNQEQGGFHLVFGNSSTTTAPFDGYFHLDIIEGKGWLSDQLVDAAGYNASQGAIFGLKKAQAGSQEDFALYADGTLNIYQAGSAKGVYDNTFPIKKSNGTANYFNFFNGAGIKLACVPTDEISEKGIQYIIGLECTPANGGSKTYIGLTNATLRPGVSAGIGAQLGTSWITQNLTKGVSYTVRLVAQRKTWTEGTSGSGFNQFKAGYPYEPILSSVGDVSELTLTYDDTNITVSAPAGQLPALGCDAIGLFTAEGNPTVEIDATKAYFVTARIDNAGAEYLGVIYPYLYDKFGHSTKLTPITVNVPAGNSADAQWYEQFDGDLYNTEYTLVLRDKYDNNIGSTLTVNVINGQNLTNIAIVKSITFSTDLGDYTQDDVVAPRVDQIFNAAVEFECLSDTYEALIYPYFRDSDGVYRFFDPYPFNLDMTKGGTFVYNPVDGIGSTSLKYNTLYQLCFGTYDGDWHPLPFDDGSDFTWVYVTKEKSGIQIIKEDNSCTVYPNPAESVTTVSADDVISEIAVYSMSGSLVLDCRYDSSNTSEQLDVTTLPAGHYVLRIVAGGQNKAARLIKR